MRYNLFTITQGNSIMSGQASFAASLPVAPMQMFQRFIFVPENNAGQILDFAVSANVDAIGTTLAMPTPNDAGGQLAGYDVAVLITNTGPNDLLAAPGNAANIGGPIAQSLSMTHGDRIPPGQSIVFSGPAWANATAAMVRAPGGKSSVTIMRGQLRVAWVNQ
jgi:hypothetical protein